uniref:C2H2-type domain-containing protein n=1 Tax=Timema douglasi TaxID=61478 RepID=A0A7R8VFE1_TIMDO|nr:unnamed protein product [Timema douglasi]
MVFCGEKDIVRKLAVDGRSNKSKDKTESQLNHASTSQEECIEPSLIEIGDKDNDDSTNDLSQNQLIFREDVAALLKQIQTSTSCNQLETRDPFKNLKSPGPKPLSLASTSFEQTKLSFNTKPQIDEVDDINQSDLENTSQEILDDFVKHVAKKKRKTNNGKVKEINQSFQWRFVKKVTDSDGQERYQCTLCKKSYASKWYLKEHLKIHTGEKNFGCSICDKRFRNNYMLNAHIRLHTGIKNFHCSFCPKKFYNNFDLVHHERHHTGEKPFKCKYCDKAFAYKRGVEIHMRTHTGERPYPCSFCGRTFIDKNQQVRHHRVHTGDRPYSCNLCGQAFKQISALCSHRRVHTDERPYSCSTCDLTYKWKSDLVKHYSTYHSDLIASVVKSRIEGDENASQLIDEAN